MSMVRFSDKVIRLQQVVL
ncbi:hypothetical protein LINPERHAP2_LOCUS13689 [Linum perenne]